LAGGEERALSVHLDGAAFEDEIVARERNSGSACDLVGDFGVVGQLILAAPAIEAETGGAVAGEDGPVSRNQMSPKAPGIISALCCSASFALAWASRPKASTRTASP